VNILKTNAAREMARRGVNEAKRSVLSSGGDFQFMADMIGNLSGVVIDEMADFVVRDATELRPGAKRADRRLFAGGEYTALAQAGDIRKLIS
jgi:hypothetical protein